MAGLYASKAITVDWPFLASITFAFLVIATCYGILVRVSSPSYLKSIPGRLETYGLVSQIFGVISLALVVAANGSGYVSIFGIPSALFYFCGFILSLAGAFWGLLENWLKRHQQIKEPNKTPQTTRTSDPRA